MSFGSWRSSASSNPRLAGLSRTSGLSSRVSSPSSSSGFGSGSTLSRSLTQLPYGSSSSLTPSSVDQFITTANSYTPSNSSHHRRSPFLKRNSGQTGSSGTTGGSSSLNSWNRASSISNLSSNPYSSQIYSVLFPSFLCCFQFSDWIFFLYCLESKSSSFPNHTEASFCSILVNIVELIQIHPKRWQWRSKLWLNIHAIAWSNWFSWQSNKRIFIGVYTLTKRTNHR